jgi:hypothetical protein
VNTELRDAQPQAVLPTEPESFVRLEVKRLVPHDVSLIATIDRSEHVDVEYVVIDGRLTERPVSMSEIPAWNPIGHGPHSVADKIGFCASLIAEGGILLGAFDNALGHRAPCSEIECQDFQRDGRRFESCQA